MYGSERDWGRKRKKGRGCPQERQITTYKALLLIRLCNKNED